VSLEKSKDAKSYSVKTSNWAYVPIDAESREAEAAAAAEAATEAEAADEDEMKKEN